MQEWLPDALEELRLDVTGTFLEELDEQNQEVEFRELMTNSVWYVLLNRCGLDAQEYLDATIRFSMSEFTTKEEIDYTLETLYNCIPMLRKYTRR